MSSTLFNRLNQILPKITSRDFLSSHGIGNEIACYIFDYSAKDELEVREHITMMMQRLATHHSEIRVLHLNLLDVLLAYLENRRLLDKAIAMQEDHSDRELLAMLKAPLAAEKISEFIATEHRPSEHDLVLISGVGSAWPMLRAHSLLNSLHKIMGKTPLVMFYPGHFDGTTLSLFGQIATAPSKPGAKPYYRAFTLVPGGTEQ